MHKRSQADANAGDVPKMDKEVLEREILKLFTRQRYWVLAQLTRHLKQPAAWVREHVKVRAELPTLPRPLESMNIVAWNHITSQQRGPRTSYHHEAFHPET
jgi:hypothetical protein